MGCGQLVLKGSDSTSSGFANHMFSVKIYLGWVSKQLWMIQKQKAGATVPGSFLYKKQRGYLGLWAKVCRLWFNSRTLLYAPVWAGSQWHLPHCFLTYVSLVSDFWPDLRFSFLYSTSIWSLLQGIKCCAKHTGVRRKRIASFKNISGWIN